MKAVVTNKYPANVPLVEDWKPHIEGDIVELSAERFKELLEKGYVRGYADEHKPEKTVEVAKKDEPKENAKKTTRKKTK